jgi:hypothetical protein
MFKDIYSKLKDTKTNTPEIKILRGRFEKPKSFIQSFKKGLEYYGTK